MRVRCEAKYATVILGHRTAKTILAEMAEVCGYMGVLVELYRILVEPDREIDRTPIRSGANPMQVVMCNARPLSVAEALREMVDRCGFPAVLLEMVLIARDIGE